MGEDHSPTFRYSERRRSAFARVTPTGWLAIAVVGAVVVLGGAVLASGLLAGGGSDWGISLFAPPTATLTATATATQTPIATQTPLPPTPTRVPPTATPAVTATPLPTATPTLAVSSISGLVSVGKATVTTEWFNANLRAGPGSEYEVLYHLPPGTVVDVFARSEDWLLVQSGKAYGWVWSGLVEMDKNLDFDAIPEWVFEAEETEEPDGDESTPEAFDAWWNLLGAPDFDAASQRATHTVVLNAYGGSGEYKFYADEEELSSNVFEVTTHLCSAQIIMARVVDSEGAEETLPIYFNTFCPTPVGCARCELWEP